MNPERKEFLNLISPPGRLSVTEAAWKLGFEPDHITILASADLLKPLGHPPPGAMKFFLTAEIEQKKNDPKWMAKASEVVRLWIRDKNEASRQESGAQQWCARFESDWRRQRSFACLTSSSIKTRVIILPCAHHPYFYEMHSYES